MECCVWWSSCQWVIVCWQEVSQHICSLWQWFSFVLFFVLTEFSLTLFPFLWNIRQVIWATDKTLVGVGLNRSILFLYLYSSLISTFVFSAWLSLINVYQAATGCWYSLPFTLLTNRCEIDRFWLLILTFIWPWRFVHETISVKRISTSWKVSKTR